MSSRFYGYRIMLFAEPMPWQGRFLAKTAQPFFCAEFSRITTRFNFLFLGALLILFFIFDIALYTENSLDCFFPTPYAQPFCFSLLIAFFVVFILFFYVLILYLRRLTAGNTPCSFFEFFPCRMDNVRALGTRLLFRILDRCQDFLSSNNYPSAFCSLFSCSLPFAFLSQFPIRRFDSNLRWSLFFLHSRGTITT